jgi:glycine reductase
MRVVHYLNQFYGRLGGEDAADVPLRAVAGPVGAGTRLQQLLGEAQLTTTLIAGDNLATEQVSSFKQAIAAALRAANADVVVAGPAFNAGRYGLACGVVCETAQELGIPSVTAMFPENPGAVLHRRHAIIVPTTATAAGMEAALIKVADLAVRLGRGERLGGADDEGYLPHGLRQVVMHQRSAAERALDMLSARLHDHPFRSEIPLPEVERVQPAAGIKELKTARIGIVTTSALVPRGNPDKLRQSYSTEWRAYSIEHHDTLDASDWESIHGGFDTSSANHDPHLVLPLDALRALEGDAFARLHESYAVTAGVGTAVSAARRMGAEIGAYLRERDVQGVILTAT